MEITRCRRCRRSLSPGVSPCPHCGGETVPKRVGDWRTARDPLHLPPAGASGTLRFAGAAALVFVLAAVLLAVCARTGTAAPHAGRAVSGAGEVALSLAVPAPQRAGGSDGGGGVRR